MSTQKVGLRSKEEFMSDYTPIYQPIYPLLMGKSQAYSEFAGKHEFRRINTVGDIRAKHITPKDSEMQLIAAGESKKAFKKYFLANQYQLSSLQDREGTEDVLKQVLDEHQKQFDELVLLGEGTSASTMLNNSLYWSADANYTLESSVEIALSDRLYDFHSKVLTNVAKANKVAGRKLIIFYGASLLPYYNSLYPTAVKPFKQALTEVLGANYSQAELPADICPSSANGWIIVNIDQIKMHYSKLPVLEDQGTNAEKKYNWFNFIMGSAMIEVLAKNAIVRQPISLETE
jgi:hypothetical protein